MDFKVYSLVLGVSFLLLYTDLTGQVFGRPDQGDKFFHILKSADPLGYNPDGYYAPLFHIVVWVLSRFLGLTLALNLFVGILIFYLLPWAFNFALEGFWSQKIDPTDSTLFYFFVPWFTVLTFIINVWPQILNMFFMLVLLGLMFRRAKSWLIILVGILGFFSHTAGGFWILLVLVFYFFLQDFWVGVIIMGVSLFILSRFHSLSHRITGIMANWIRSLDLNWGRLFELFFLWINPVSLYLILQGSKIKRFDWRDLILFFAVLVVFGSTLLDSQLRPVLNGMLLLGFYGFESFRRSKAAKVACLSWGITWWIVLSYAIITIS